MNTQLYILIVTIFTMIKFILSEQISLYTKIPIDSNKYSKYYLIYKTNYI